MIENSYICQLIRDNPDDWEKIIKKKDLYVKREASDGAEYAIFNYDVSADFSDPVVREARGIIIDLKTLDVVCWPFTKFCNWEEKWHDEIDWESAHAEEKIDGSIIKHWFDPAKGEWTWSTNSEIDASKAKSNGKSFLYLIKSCLDYADIDDDSLDKGRTYIFELTGPMNRVIVDYPVPELWYLSSRDNKTGQEDEDDVK